MVDNTKTAAFTYLLSAALKLTFGCAVGLLLGTFLFDGANALTKALAPVVFVLGIAALLTIALIAIVGGKRGAG